PRLSTLRWVDDAKGKLLSQVGDQNFGLHKPWSALPPKQTLTPRKPMSALCHYWTSAKGQERISASAIAPVMAASVA
ncbi:MAG: hypothetical protein WA697_00025, partial [Pseudolabrys sp.]